MAETVRTPESRLGWPVKLASYFQSELISHFGDAWATGYEPLVFRMENDEKDRHVLAPAVSNGAGIIVTSNLRHFQEKCLGRWGIAALHLASFLCTLSRLDPAIVMAKLRQQAAGRGRSLPELLMILAKTVPEFVDLISSKGIR
jgi:hypothetical protein